MIIASIGLIGASNIQTRKQEMNVECINQNCLKVEGKITEGVKVLYTSKMYWKWELKGSGVLIIGYVSV